MQRSVLYNLGFATAVCIVCAVGVSGAAVVLQGRQQANAALDKQKNVLVAAGLAKDGEDLSRAMLRAGMAVRYSDELRTVEDLTDEIAAQSARAEGLGLYGSRFENPRDYRRRLRKSGGDGS